MNLKNLATACFFIAFSSNAMNVADEENRHLAGVALPHVEKHNQDDHYIEISPRYRFIQKDLIRTDEGPGYDALYTSRNDVYNTIRELCINRWNQLSYVERDTLKYLVNACIKSCGYKFKYRNSEDWGKLDNFLQQNVINTPETNVELIELICYMKHSNVTIFYDLNTRHYTMHHFNPTWEMIYLQQIDEPVQTWKRLIPRR